MAGFKDIPKGEIDFVNPRNDPYRVLLGKYVSIQTTNNHYAGIYRGITTNHDLVLLPSIVRGKGNTLYELVWETDLPVFVNNDTRQSIEPTSKEVIDAGIALNAEKEKRQRAVSAQ